MPRFLDEISYYDSNGTSRNLVPVYEHCVYLYGRGINQFYVSFNIISLDATPWDSLSAFLSALKSRYGEETVYLNGLGARNYSTSRSWTILVRARFYGSDSQLVLDGIPGDYGTTGEVYTDTITATSTSAYTTTDKVFATGWRVFA